MWCIPDQSRRQTNRGGGREERKFHRWRDGQGGCERMYVHRTITTGCPRGIRIIGTIVQLEIINQKVAAAGDDQLGAGPTLSF